MSWTASKFKSVLNVTSAYSSRARRNDGNSFSASSYNGMRGAFEYRLRPHHGQPKFQIRLAKPSFTFDCGIELAWQIKFRQLKLAKFRQLFRPSQQPYGPLLVMILWLRLESALRNRTRNVVNASEYI